MLYHKSSHLDTDGHCTCNNRCAETPASPSSGVNPLMPVCYVRTDLIERLRLIRSGCHRQGEPSMVSARLAANRRKSWPLRRCDTGDGLAFSCHKMATPIGELGFGGGKGSGCADGIAAAGAARATGSDGRWPGAWHWDGRRWCLGMAGRVMLRKYNNVA